MIYTITELEQKVNEKVYAVYEIFKNFFGEEYVDLQNVPSGNRILPSSVRAEDLPTTDIDNRRIGQIKRRLTENGNYPFILVYWPTVTVTNEYNKSIVIKDLYAKVTITVTGLIPYEYSTFQLNRSTYNVNQFSSNYMHSHVCEIPVHDFSKFQNPCLGRGPIRNTISTLNEEYNEVTWMLFCRELSLYVTVESISGVPYHKLEEVGKPYPLDDYNKGFNNNIENTSFELEAAPLFEQISQEGVRNFIAYYLNNGHLKVSFINGMYVCGLPFYDYIIDISNSFIQFFNENYADPYKKNELYILHVLRKVFIKDTKFSGVREVHSAGLNEYIGEHVCHFKGNDIRLRIEETPDNDDISLSTVLSAKLALHLLNRILKVINCRFKNGYTQSERTGFSQEGTSSSDSQARYL